MLKIELITTKEVSKKLEITYRKTLNLFKSGRLTVEKVNRRYYVDKRDWERFLRNCEEENEIYEDEIKRQKDKCLDLWKQGFDIETLKKIYKKTFNEIYEIHNEIGAKIQKYNADHFVELTIYNYFMNEELAA
jgi:hypothetical protein